MFFFFSEDSWKFLVTVLFFVFSFFGVDGSVQQRQLKISRHYFVFSFSFFFFSISTLYYAQDSCKKWQENIDKLGLGCRMNCFQNFLSLIFFSFLLWRDWSVQLRRLKISRHYFVFSFSFSLSAYLLYYAQDSCKEWQENKGKLGLRSRMNGF